MQPVAESYVLALMTLMAEDGSVVALVADMSLAKLLCNIQKSHPQRFRVTTAGRIGMLDEAIDLCDEGYRPWLHMPSAFSSTRGCESLRTEVFFTGRNVKLVGFHGGFSSLYSTSGNCDRAIIDDLGVLRSMPCSVVVVPCDCFSVKSMVRQIASMPGPVYMRLEPSMATDVYTDESPETPSFGRGIILANEVSVEPGVVRIAVVAAGSAVGICLDAVRIVEQLGVSAIVVDMHTIKPVDEMLVRRLALTWHKLATVEFGAPIGGLYGAVADALCDFGMMHCISRISLNKPDALALAGRIKEVAEDDGEGHRAWPGQTE